MSAGAGSNAPSAMSITPLGVTSAGVTVLLSSPGVLTQTVPTAFQTINSTAALYGSNATVALSNAALLRAGGEMSGALTLSNAPLELSATSGVGGAAGAAGATVVHVTSNAVPTAWITADGRAAFMGALGVGASNPQAPLHVNGANGDGVSIICQYDVASTSDARDKTAIRRIDGALDRVRRLTGYTYERRDDPGVGVGLRYAGLLAQEVREVLPEVVHEGPDGRLTLAYGNVVALLVEAIKDLSAEVAELRMNARA